MTDPKLPLGTISRDQVHAFLSALHTAGHHVEHRSVGEWLDAGEACLLAAAETLRAAGWMVSAPGSVPIPRTKSEAQAMNLISERWLKDNIHG